MTKLEPPPVPPLPPGTRARLRRRILDQTRPVHQPTAARRWAPALVAATAVAGVSVGVAVHGARTHGEPAPASTTGQAQAGRVVTTDKGRANAAAIANAMDKCLLYWHGSTKKRAQAEVLYARMYSYTSMAGFNKPAVGMLFTVGNAYYYVTDSSCRKESEVLMVGAKKKVEASAGKNKLAEAWDKERPEYATMRSDSFVRVPPKVARLQARRAWDNGASDWYESPIVANGYALVTYTVWGTPANRNRMHAHDEFRAYDANGLEVKLG
ncbi:hypothetical protein OG394_05490 [Kribbella sp. NBC_01245]|uniref:hypothetical protein n=1 Tax=Kribbella sp. NBC_01245 TaxID=2903578 RepID=UPI002E27C191|nr:hypothetical protein [Kribbella sp. NBC_01245]